MRIQDRRAVSVLPTGKSTCDVGVQLVESLNVKPGFGYPVVLPVTECMYAFDVLVKVRIRSSTGDQESVRLACDKSRTPEILSSPSLSRDHLYNISVEYPTCGLTILRLKLKLRVNGPSADTAVAVFPVASSRPVFIPYPMR